MSEKAPPKADWLYLPNDVEETSLWGCLHDGELISCASDVLECSVVLEIKVDHLIEDKTTPTTFLLKLENVESVRTTAHFRFVGKFEEPENISEVERRKLIGENLIWREESFSWSEFEIALNTDPLLISNADYVSRNDETTLRLGGFLDGEKFDDIYFDVFLRGKTLTASRSDGKDFSLEAFINLGRKYWDSFGK